MSLQENNHLAIVDLERAKVHPRTSRPAARPCATSTPPRRTRPAGRQGLIELVDTITRRREPDAVKWIDDDTFATANEGDYGTRRARRAARRGFTLFSARRPVEYESGASSSTRSCAPATSRRRARRTRATSPKASRSRRSAGARCCSSAPSAPTPSASTTSSRHAGVPAAPAHRHRARGHPGDPGARAAGGRRPRPTAWPTASRPLARDALRARPRAARVPVYRERRGTRGLPIPWVAISGLAGDR